MSARLVLLVAVLAIPAPSQNTNAQVHLNHILAQRQQQLIEGNSSPEMDSQTARRQAVKEDATELSLISASVHADLQQLQRGVLAKDLHENLKKMERLSKKLRKEME
jgi:hypothetical protein